MTNYLMQIIEGRNSMLTMTLNNAKIWTTHKSLITRV